jgi:hypothetical protein
VDVATVLTGAFSHAFFVWWDAEDGAAADNGSMRISLARWLILAMAALALVVQIGVWGGTKIQADGGSLLQSWRPYFGWPYGLAFATVQTAVCVCVPIRRGVVWLLRTWAITGGALFLLSIAVGTSSRLTVDSGVALVAGIGALVLAAGMHEGHLAAVLPPRVRNRS